MSNYRLLILSLLMPILVSSVSNSGVQAQGPAASPTSFAPSPAAAGPDCFDALANLSSCLTYVEKGSNLTTPDKGCCPALAGLVESQPICLCQLLSTSNAFGVTVDDTKALALPTICRVKTPPVSLCNALGIPVASPEAISPGGGAGQPGLAPATQTAAPSSGGGGGLPALFLTLLAVVGQEALFFF